MKRISEKKLEAFTVGTMGKRQLSKRELEEQKKKEDEAAAAHAFQEFVETFQQTPNPSTKVWVKAGTYDAGSRKEDNREKGKLYKPSSKLEDKSATDKAQEYAKLLASDLKKDTIPAKKKSQEKKKSNLELFKEELRQIQEEREERHKYKQMITQTSTVTHTTEVRNTETRESQHSGSFDTGDPNTTNLYLGNLSPKISEQQLMEIFGRYGPLASIKIMWPRSEEEKLRGRNCGFVAYMSRKDAERALKTLNGRYVMSYEMRLGWGKAVPIMNQPIFIPPPLLELTMPPPPSGLPFNAQPPPSEANNITNKNYKEYTTDEEKDNMNRILMKSVVKVIIPTEKTVLHVIHRMIEFVIREGPMFEALIMSRELENPMFSFLFDNESPAHIYYRWKLFSLLQGDTPTEWSEKEFRMFKNGPVWRPPIANFYTQGMSDDLVVDPDAPEIHKGALSVAQRDRLEDVIHHLTPERSRVGDAMIFCIEHADAADEICECIAESLANATTLASKKIARLYLISDLLHNCTVKVSNASFFRKSVEKHLVDVFENLHIFYNAIESRLKAEGFKTRVLNVLHAWDDWTVYSKDFLAQLRHTFLGKQNTDTSVATDEVVKDDMGDIDGALFSGDEKEEEDLDGVPLDGVALLKGVLMRGLSDTQSKIPAINRNQELTSDNDYNDDIDGVPLEEDIEDAAVLKAANEYVSTSVVNSNMKGGGFIPSKWETIDPEQVEAQAVTTSKWDSLDTADTSKYYSSCNSATDDDQNDSDYNEVKRNHLRDIELKTMEYQDELEFGQRELKSGWTIAEQVEEYRRKLLRQDNHNTTNYLHKKDNYKYDDNDSGSRISYSPAHNSNISTNNSPSNSRKRSRSPLTSNSNHTNRSSSSHNNNSSNSSSKYSKHHKSSSLSPSTLPKTDRLPLHSKSSRSDASKSANPIYRSPSPTRTSSSSGSYRTERHKQKHTY